jgi:hypothetical protein
MVFEIQLIDERLKIFGRVFFFCFVFWFFMETLISCTESKATKTVSLVTLHVASAGQNANHIFLEDKDLG